MNQKPIYVTRPEMPPLKEYVAKLSEIWDSRWLTNMGEIHRRLEEGLKEYLKVENLMLFTNGHVALEAAIEALGLRGEVITTPFTFSSTTHAIVRRGLTPVFCDIDPKSYTIDPNRIEELITENTSAILPVHVYGNVCDVDAIEKIAKRHHLKVIYDAAHAFSVKKDEKSILDYGDASMISFHATKVFNTVEGGAVVYQDASLGKVLRSIRNFGIRSETEVDLAGGNAKMDEFRAAMGLCNLPYIDTYIEKRKILACRYRERLKHLPGVTVCMDESDSDMHISRNYSYFPILVDPEEAGIDRDQIYEALKSKDIYTRKYFYPLTSDLECYRTSFSSNRTPVAARIAGRVLTLPLYSSLTVEEVDWICDETCGMIGGS